MAIKVRAGIASAIGFAILIAGFSGAGRGSVDLAWFLLVFLGCQGGAFYIVRRASRRAESARLDALIEARREKMRERDDPRVTGKMCVACDRRIVIEHDGERCETCRGPVHLKCLKDHRAAAHTQTEHAYR
jgi:hypothetical protein